jgi:hypothetical protein
VRPSPPIVTGQVGIVGVPPLSVIGALNEAGATLHDLDAKLVPDSIDGASPILPRVYCAILRTVALNALRLPLDAIYIDVGPGKCDAALHVATILGQTLPVPVIPTRNLDTAAFGNPLCEARMPMIAKFQAITEGVKRAAPHAPLPACQATAAFWGVPPRDFSILAPFPDSTHVYGWTRCMENKTPADHALEMVVDPAVPTVFFAQSFCAKTALARHLASRHPHALVLDADFHAGASARAKIQAFLELSGALS